MKLRELVEQYRSLSGGFGRPAALAAFGLGREQTEQLFGAFDEDYHISRFFHFSLDPNAGPSGAYRINGFPQSHLVLDPEIESIL